MKKLGTLLVILIASISVLLSGCITPPTGEQEEENIVGEWEGLYPLGDERSITYISFDNMSNCEMTNIYGDGLISGTYYTENNTRVFIDFDTHNIWFHYEVVNETLYLDGHEFN